jgi:tetratricopeptide (TPR) repeat protein
VGFFDRVLSLWQEDTSPDERIARAGVLRERASAASRIGRFEDALRSLDAAEEDLRAAGIDPSDAVHVWLLLDRGLMLKEYGRIDESIAVLARANEMCRVQPPSTLQMRVYGALAFQRNARGDRDQARAEVEEGLRIGQQLTIRDGAWHMAMGRLKDAEGSLYFFAGDLPRAEAAFKAALELREQTTDAAGVPDGWINLGGIAYTRGDLAQAVSYYERALAVAKKARWLAREAACQSNLGQAKLAMGEPEIAATNLGVACQLAEEGGYIDILADSTRALAEVELARGDLAAATQRVDAAITHAERAKALALLATAHATAMDVWLARLTRDRERAAFERAKKHKEEACAILGQMGQLHTAETVARRFGQGSNATVDT